MFQLLEPNRIFSITSKAPKYVLLLFILVVSIGLTEALILSPEDYKQSHSVRIMYVHVPLSGQLPVLIHIIHLNTSPIP